LAAVRLTQRLTSGSQRLMFDPMNATLTSADRQLLKQLLKVGRWNSQTEVIRYALFLLKDEVERGGVHDLTPYSHAALRRAARRASREDIAADRRLGKASARFRPEIDP